MAGNGDSESQPQPNDSEVLIRGELHEDSKDAGDHSKPSNSGDPDSMDQWLDGEGMAEESLSPDDEPISGVGFFDQLMKGDDDDDHENQKIDADDPTANDADGGVQANDNDADGGVQGGLATEAEAYPDNVGEGGLLGALATASAPSSPLADSINKHLGFESNQSPAGKSHKSVSLMHSPTHIDGDDVTQSVGFFDQLMKEEDAGAQQELAMHADEQDMDIYANMESDEDASESGFLGGLVTAAAEGSTTMMNREPLTKVGTTPKPLSPASPKSSSPRNAKLAQLANKASSSPRAGDRQPFQTTSPRAEDHRPNDQPSFFMPKRTSIPPDADDDDDDGNKPPANGNLKDLSQAASGVNASRGYQPQSEAQSRPQASEAQLRPQASEAQSRLQASKAQSQPQASEVQSQPQAEPSIARSNVAAPVLVTLVKPPPIAPAQVSSAPVIPQGMVNLITIHDGDSDVMKLAKNTALQCMFGALTRHWISASVEELVHSSILRYCGISDSMEAQLPSAPSGSGALNGVLSPEQEEELLEAEDESRIRIEGEEEEGTYGLAANFEELQWLVRFKGIEMVQMEAQLYWTLNERRAWDTLITTHKEAMQKLILRHEAATPIQKAARRPSTQSKSRTDREFGPLPWQEEDLMPWTEGQVLPPLRQQEWGTGPMATYTHYHPSGGHRFWDHRSKGLAETLVDVPMPYHGLDPGSLPRRDHPIPSHPHGPDAIFAQWQRYVTSNIIPTPPPLHSSLPGPPLHSRLHPLSYSWDPRGFHPHQASHALHTPQRPPQPQVKVEVTADPTLSHYTYPPPYQHPIPPIPTKPRDPYPPAAHPVLASDMHRDPTHPLPADYMSPHSGPQPEPFHPSQPGMPSPPRPVADPRPTDHHTPQRLPEPTPPKLESGKKFRSRQIHLRAFHVE